MPGSTRIVTKTLVFNQAGQVLLLVRSDDDDHRPGEYDLPGGKVEDGESIEAGAARELEEEAGIVVEPMALRLTYGVTSFSEADKLNRVKLAFIVHSAQSDITLSHEHQAYSWENLDKALVLLRGTT